MGFVIRTRLFIMMKKTKHLRIRISESQFKRLTETKINEQKNTSSILREALENYMGTDERVKKKNNNQRKEI